VEEASAVHALARVYRVANGALIALAMGCTAATPASGNWLTSLVRDFGEIAGNTSMRATRAAAELGPLGKAVAYLETLRGAPNGTLAAHATPEGHWQFANRAGEIFTVGTADEMRRVLSALAPDAAASGERKLTLYLSEDSLFANRGALDQIPRDADLHIVTDDGAYPVTRSGKGEHQVLTARPKPNLTIDLVDQPLFDETMFLLARTLKKSSIRTIALERGAGKSLSSAPRTESETKVPLVDKLDPSHFGEGLRAIRGQTALVTGRIDDGKLIVAPAHGTEISLEVDGLVAAARQNDVNLIILQSDTTRQAGGRNWLWQKIEVGGLSETAEGTTFGDFLDALAARRGGFKLMTSRDGPDRVHIAAVPDYSAVGFSGHAANAIEDLVSHVTGEVVTKAIDIRARDRGMELEYDARLIPGVPTSIQFPYLIGVVAGLLAWPTARRWWTKILTERDDVVQHAATPSGRLASGLVFILVFLPLVGIPAFLVQTGIQVAEVLLAPLRWLRRVLASKA
jgi:hypothetical protein